MIYCEYCGQGMELTDRYCPNCGAPAPIQAAQTGSTVQTGTAADEETATASTGAGEYEVILESIGSCSTSNATDLLRDALGYTIIEAQQLLGAVPTEVAANLTKEQAQYIAQALTEYGMEVEILKNGSSVDLSESATESVFDSAGSFIKKALLVLGGLTSLNRLKRFTKLTRPPYQQQTIFRPNYRPEPPKHVRRQVSFRNEPPRPAPQPGWQGGPGAQNVRPGSVPQGTPNVRPGNASVRPGSVPQGTPNVRPGNASVRPQSSPGVRPGAGNTRPQQSSPNVSNVRPGSAARPSNTRPGAGSSQPGARPGANPAGPGGNGQSRPGSQGGPGGRR